jgi:hypothetical protein
LTRPAFPDIQRFARHPLDVPNRNAQKLSHPGCRVKVLIETESQPELSAFEATWRAPALLRGRTTDFTKPGLQLFDMEPPLSEMIRATVSVSADVNFSLSHFNQQAQSLRETIRSGFAGDRGKPSIHLVPIHC